MTSLSLLAGRAVHIEFNTEISIVLSVHSPPVRTLSPVFPVYIIAPRALHNLNEAFGITSHACCDMNYREH